MDEIDVLVIGSGTGGQTAAFELNDAGLKVAVSEKSDRPGGTCALRGCQPKKWCYEATETVAKSRHLKGKGIVDPASARWSDIRAQKNHFTSHVPENTIEAFRAAGIHFMPGRAAFLSPNTMEVGGKPITARYYILATGAKPISLPIKGRENLYEAVPSMLFTYPQYGMLGKTEAALLQQDIPYRKSFAKDLQWPTYRRVGLKHAAYKILVGANNRGLGAHILSDNASGLINTLKQAMINRTTVEEFYWQSIMSPYPTRESDLIYMLKPLV